MIEDGWLPAPARPALRENEIHIWKKTLRFQNAREQSQLETFLSEDELQRASRFRFHEHRERFLVGRATLRRILAGYLGTDPEALKFQYSARGKPSLNPDARLKFNLAHSHDLAVYAVTLENEIGIDLEQINPSFPCLDVAKRVFTADEMNALAATTPSDKQTELFFTLWSCKEALLKAIGEGLFSDPKGINVRFASDQKEPVLQSLTGDNPARWSLQILQIGGAYKSAVAVQGCINSIRFFHPADL